MPTIEDLRLATGQLVTEDWYDDLCDILNQLGYEGPISLYGYVTKDLIPIQDLLLNLGIPLRRFKELHVGTATIATSATIAGKTVLKDGDPITVDNFGASAKTKIGEAVDDGLDSSADIETIKTNTGNTVTEVQHVESDVEATKIAVDNLMDRFLPHVLDKSLKTAEGDMVDIFGSDLTVLYDGRVRTKWSLGSDGYAYILHTPSATATEMMACLNAGAVIPGECWYEFDFTVMTGDKVNFQVTPGQTLSIIVYNIGNA